MKILIKNALIITQNKKRDIISRGFIVLNNDKIESIGEGDYKIDKSSEKYKIINAKNLMILPGFINSHVHLGESVYQNLFKGKYSLEDYLRITEEITRKTNLIEKKRKTIVDYSLSQLLLNGTTTICGGRTAEFTEPWGIRNVSGYMVMNSFKLRSLSLEIEKQFSLEYKKIKKMKFSFPALFVHSLNNIDIQILPAIKRIMEKFSDVILILHVAETKKSEQEIKKKFGLSTIMVLRKNKLLNERTGLIHGNWLSKKDLNLVKQSGASLVHCLSSNLKVADRALNLLEVVKKNIKSCVATDGVVTSDTFSVLDEAKKCFLYYQDKKRNISGQVFLDLITVNAAKVLNLDKIVGSIEENKKADLVFIKKNIFIDLDKWLLSNNKVYGVIIDGKVRVWNNKILKEKIGSINKNFLYLIKQINKISHENNIS